MLLLASTVISIKKHRSRLHSLVYLEHNGTKHDQGRSLVALPISIQGIIQGVMKMRHPYRVWLKISLLEMNNTISIGVFSVT